MPTGRVGPTRPTAPCSWSTALTISSRVGIGGPAPGIPDAAAGYSMWVDPAERGKGLGSALIDAIKTWAKDAGYANLGLGVITTNTQAIALYERLGFVETGDRFQIRTDPDVTILIMAMALTDPG